MRRVLAMLVVACILAIGGYVAVFYLARPSPQKALERMRKAYASAGDYTAKSKTSVAMNMMGMDMQMNSTQTVSYKPPMLLKMKVEGSGMTGNYEVLCDGKQSYARMEGLGAGKQWVKQEVPEAITDLTDATGYGTMGDGIQPLTLVGGADPTKDVKTATLDSGVLWKPRKPLVLSLTLKDGGTQKLWLDRQTYLIRRSEWHPSMDMGDALAKASASEGKAASEGADAMMKQWTDRMKGMKMVVTEEYQEVRLGSGLKAADFAFKPGQGEKVLTEDKYYASIREAMGAKEEGPDLVGKPAPDFTVTDVAGKPLKLSDLKGKPVLIDFCASWCGPCRQELPEVQQIYKEFSGKGLQVVALSSDRDQADLEKWLKDEGVTFRAAWLDPMKAESRTVSSAYGVTGIPRVVLIDKDGVIRAALTGSRPKAELVKELGKVGL
jgi:peroxiredoxin/outer membrane lipoprotein-sorting protein